MVLNVLEGVVRFFTAFSLALLQGRAPFFKQKKVSPNHPSLCDDDAAKPKKLVPLESHVMGWDSVFLVVGGYLLTFICVVALTYLLTPFVRAVLEAKPSVVKETTRSCQPQIIAALVATLRYYFAPLNNNAPVTAEETFDDLVVPAETKKSIVDLAFALRAARTRGAPFRHVVLHGPPGVGKCLTANKLASAAGLDFACVCGRDVITTGEEAVSQMQTLFSWAKLSPDGMLLFVEQAETFLGSQDSPVMSDTEGGHEAISTFLYNLAKLRRGVIMVLSTNRVQDLESEVLEHFEERIFLSLPDATCRESLCTQYFDSCVRKYVVENNASAHSLKPKLTRYFTRQSAVLLRIDKDVMTGDQLNETVAATRGLSGKDIRELMTATLGVFVASENGTLDSASCWEMVEAKVKHHWDTEILAGEHHISYLDGDLDLQDVTFV